MQGAASMRGRTAGRSRHCPARSYRRITVTCPSNATAMTMQQCSSYCMSLAPRDPAWWKIEVRCSQAVPQVAITQATALPRVLETLAHHGHSGVGTALSRRRIHKQVSFCGILAYKSWQFYNPTTSTRPHRAIPTPLPGPAAINKAPGCLQLNGDDERRSLCRLGRGSGRRQGRELAQAGAGQGAGKRRATEAIGSRRWSPSGSRVSRLAEPGNPVSHPSQTLIDAECAWVQGAA